MKYGALSIGMIAVLLTAGCARVEGPEPGAGRSTPPSPTTSPSPTPSSSPTPSTPPVRPPLWSVDLSDKEDGITGGGSGWTRGEVGRVGDRFVMTAGMTVRAYDEKGKPLWKRSFERPEKGLAATGDLTMALSRDAVVVTYAHPTDDRWPHPDIVESLDPANGKTRWKRTASPYVTVTDRAVYTPVCKGKQTGRSDDCRLSARDPRTGRPQWTVDAEHVATVVDDSDDVVLVSTKPMGFRGKSWVTALDARSGSRLGARVEAAAFGGDFYPGKAERVTKTQRIAGRLVVLGGIDPKGDKACKIDLEGVDARSGADRWQRQVRTAPDIAGTYCRLGLPEGAGTTLFTSDTKERPEVFDLITGRPIWRGPKPGTIVAGDGRRVLVLDEEKGELGLYDTKTEQPGRELWSVPSPSQDRQYVKAVFDAKTVVVHENGYSGCTGARGPDGCADVYDVSTGKRLMTTEGEPAGYGRGWVATRERSSEGATIRVYSLR